jgi:hypothetical protein
MSGSSFSEFIIKNIANIFLELFKKSTFLKEPSTTSLKLSSSNRRSTLQCDWRHIGPIYGFLSIDLEIHYSKTSLNSSKGGILGWIHMHLSFEEIIAKGILQ